MSLTNTPKAAAYAIDFGVQSAKILHGIEKASSTYLAGAFLQDDDSGSITESASPIDGSAVTKRAFGLALIAATGVTATDVPLVWLDNQAIIEITLSDATAGTHTLVAGDMWKVYPITKSTNWYLDANATSTTGGGIVVGFKDALGVVDARVYMIITSTGRGGAHTGSGVY